MKKVGFQNRNPTFFLFLQSRTSNYNTMKYELIKLPYEANALEPVISKETLGFHHGKHLNAYVNNLNAAIEGTKYEDMPLEDIVKTADGGVFNNAGQILNHNLYFTQFRAPRATNKSTGVIAEWIDKQFGSFEAFKEEFTKKGATLFGSGWVWLSVDKDGKLQITSMPITSTIRTAVPTI